MKSIGTLTDSDFGLNSKRVKYRKRRTSKAILIKDNYIGIIKFRRDKQKYISLPGGGIKKNESPREGVIREIKEETGYSAKIICELGSFVEKRSKIKLCQISYCFIAKALKKGKTNLTKAEKSTNTKCVWVKMPSAIKMVEKNTSEEYNSKFVRKRTLVILKEAKKVLGTKKII